ncbi:MAG TPA: HEAT repeat domain-containing protein [Longimicrobiales bacterium]|nr:HEAT repeat domain-containing protein [Longimicrobiales bacterium]
MSPAAAGPGVLLAVIIAVIAVSALALAFALGTAILRIRNDAVAARWARLEAAWEPLILDVLVGERPPAALHAAVRASERLNFVDYLVRFARRFRGEERALLSGLARPYLHLVEPRVRHADAEIRARAVQTLATLRLEEHEGVVVAALDDRSHLVAMTAMRMLASKEHPRYAPQVLARLERFDALSRRFLAAMLAAMGPSAAPALRATLGDRDRGERVRTTAALALALLADPQAGDAAADVVAAGAGPDLVASALRLLARVGTGAHADVVRAAAESPEEVPRAQAMATLARIGDASDLPRLRKALDDPDPWVAVRAAYALEELGGCELLRGLAVTDHPRALLAREVLEFPAA